MNRWDGTSLDTDDGMVELSNPGGLQLNLDRAIKLFGKFALRPIGRRPNFLSYAVRRLRLPKRTRFMIASGLVDRQGVSWTPTWWCVGNAG